MLYDADTIKTNHLSIDQSILKIQRKPFLDT